MRIVVASRGGQTLTCAICWSGARGLDLLGLERRQVGQRDVGLGGCFRGRRPFGGRCLGGWRSGDWPSTRRFLPSRRLGGWGSRGWHQLEVRGTCSTKEDEVNQHISQQIKTFVVHQEDDLQHGFFLNSSLHPHGLTRRLRGRRRGFTGLRHGPRHGDGNSGSGRRACPFSFGLGLGGGRGRATGGCYKLSIKATHYNEQVSSYQAGSSSCALRLRASRWPCGTRGKAPINGTRGKAPINSTLWSEELSRRVSPSVPSPASELMPSVDSLLP
jgi:hypothetical protein